MQISMDAETGEITEGGEEIIVDAEPLTSEQLEQQYKDRVISLIREKYTADDEFAILRKNAAGIDGSEFSEYNAFVEQCKAQAKAELGL